MELKSSYPVSCFYLCFYLYFKRNLNLEMCYISGIYFFNFNLIIIFLVCNLIFVKFVNIMLTFIYICYRVTKHDSSFVFMILCLELSFSFQTLYSTLNVKRFSFQILYSTLNVKLESYQKRVFTAVKLWKHCKL